MATKLDIRPLWQQFPDKYNKPGWIEPTKEICGAHAYMLKVLDSHESQHDWNKLVSTLGQPAKEMVRHHCELVFREIRLQFPKSAINARIRASKAQTFLELREAIEAAWQ